MINFYKILLNGPKFMQKNIPKLSLFIDLVFIQELISLLNNIMPI